MFISTCPANQTKETISGQPTAPVKWEALTATDNSGEAVNVTCSAISGSHFSIGETEVVCKTEDASGNTATCSFYVTVEGMYTSQKVQINIASPLPSSKDGLRMIFTTLRPRCMLWFDGEIMFYYGFLNDFAHFGRPCLIL